MGTLLVRHAAVMQTLDGEYQELPDDDLLAKDGFLCQFGPTVQSPSTANGFHQWSHKAFSALFESPHNRFFLRLNAELRDVESVINSPRYALH